MFLLIPFINKGLLSINKQYFKRLLFFIFFITSVIQFICSGIGYFSVDAYYLNSGISFLWIFIVYIFGAYVRLYGIKSKNNIRNFLVFVICNVATFLFFIVNDTVFPMIKIPFKFQIFTYSFPFIFLGSLYLFKFFINLDIKKGKKLIAKISSVSFSIYLITVHPYFAFSFESGIFKKYANINIFLLLVCVFMFVVITYSACTIIALCVKAISNKLGIFKMTEFIVSKIKNIYYRIDFYEYFRIN